MCVLVGRFPSGFFLCPFPNDLSQCVVFVSFPSRSSRFSLRRTLIARFGWDSHFLSPQSFWTKGQKTPVFGPLESLVQKQTVFIRVGLGHWKKYATGVISSQRAGNCGHNEAGHYSDLKTGGAALLFRFAFAWKGKLPLKKEIKQHSFPHCTYCYAAQ